MKRLILIAAALSLPACALPSFSLGTAPTPLASTVVDDKALDAAWRSFDIALDALDLWMDAKPSVIGTPKAIKIADGIDKVTTLLTAAEKAASAGSTKDYAEALTDAKAALVELRVAMKGN